MEAGVLVARRARVARFTALGARVQLTGIVVMSLVLRGSAAVAHVTPRLFPDEYIYSALGRSIGQHGTVQIRGATAHFPALLEPLLAAPIWAAAPTATAYRLVQLENALFMSLAAIPVFLIARRLRLSQGYALLCALFAVAIPDLLFSDYVLADPIAYPLALTAIFAGLVALERPSRRSQAAFLAAAALSTAARVQYATLVLAFAATAVALERRRVLRRHLVVVVSLATCVAGALALGASRLLGYYSGVVHLHLGTKAAGWAATDVFLLALASGAVLAPGAVAGVLRPVGRTETAFALLAGVFGAGTLAEAALYASNGSARFQERYLFVLLPLVPIAAGLHARREHRPRVVPLLVAAGLAAALSAWPLSGWATGTGTTDSPFLSAVAFLSSHVGVASGSLGVALALSAAAALGAVPQLARRSSALPAVALALLVATSVAATVRDRDLSVNVRSEYVATDPAWVDARRLRGVVAIQTANAPAPELLEQLFWNQSVQRELLLDGASATDAFSAPRVWIARNGTLHTAAGIVRSPILFGGNAVSATLTGATPVARRSRFTLWMPVGIPRVRILEINRYWDGWLAWDGSITVWPNDAGRARGTLSLSLSLPLRARPVQIAFGGRRLTIEPGERRALRWRVDGIGPQTLSFRTSGGTIAADFRPVSVRSTMPIFTPDLKHQHRPADR